MVHEEFEALGDEPMCDVGGEPVCRTLGNEGNDIARPPTGP